MAVKRSLVVEHMFDPTPLPNAPHGGIIETYYTSKFSLSEIFQSLKRGDCWCEMGIGNPMYTEHSKGCQMVQQFLEKEFLEKGLNVG